LRGTRRATFPRGEGKSQTDFVLLSPIIDMLYHKIRHVFRLPRKRREKRR